MRIRLGRVAGAAPLLLLPLFQPIPAFASPTPTFSIGNGPSRIVEYDALFRQVRTFRGLQAPTDITPLPDGSVLVADEGASEALSFDRSTGRVHWRRRFESGVQRVRPRARSGFVVVSTDRILLTNAALDVEREVPARGVRAAVELSNGNLLVAANDGEGYLTELRPDGSVAWRSKPAWRRNTEGRWVPESEDAFFRSPSSLDLRSDGTILAGDYDGHSVRLLASDYRVLRFWRLPGQGHYTDIRFGPSGELVVVAPEARAVSVERRDGKVSVLTIAERSLAFCANLSPAGTLLVGLRWQPEAVSLNASQRPPARKTPFHETLPGVVLIGVSAALLVGSVVRSPELARRPVAPAGNLESDREDPAGGDPARPAAEAPGRARWVAVAVGAMLVVSLYRAWRTTLEASGGVASGKMLAFAIACGIGGLALRMLNGVAGTSGTFSRFSPGGNIGRPLPPDRRRTRALVILSLSSLATCLYVVTFRPDLPGLAVGAWAAAQVLLLAAAFDRPGRPIEPFRRTGFELPLLGLTLLGAIALRFWQLSYYPDFIHWDHGIYGRAALRVLQGEWSPFFVMDPNSPSISRPWVAVGSALLGLFGRHYWVLRVTSAVSGVVLVFATYRLASVLFNRRVGLGAAFLVSVNHVLLLYSRQSYVLDPAPFFVLALYCAVVGLERGSRFAWCLAGVLSGWTLLTYWASTALAFVGAAIFAGFVVFYARSLWRRRMGLLWMVLGLGVVYLPMLSHMKSSSNLSARLRESTVIFDPGGSIQRDPSFWRSQIGRTFGTILQLSDQSPWGIWTYKPILIGIETVLFGVGLAYLLVSGRRAPTLLILIWLTFGFFLGNGLFRDPEVLYHCLAAIPPILILCAVAVDRLLALGDPIRSPLLRALPASAAVVLLAFIGFLNFRTAWALVGRPAAHRPDGRIALRADVRSIVPRFVREHPTYRYYLVRTPTELSSAAPSFIFFGDDSDLTDVTEDLSGVLPVPPGVGDGAAFVVLPGRSGDSAQVRAAYPTARTVEWIATDSPEPVRIHLVDEAALRRAYEASRRR